MTQRIERIVLRRVTLPLRVPYRLSYRTFFEFEPIVVEAHDDQGAVGWGEGHISPGSGAETRAGGWNFCRRLAPQLVGCEVQSALYMLWDQADASPVAATALATALEMLERHPALIRDQDKALPLSTPVNALDDAEIETELADKLAAGFGTFKVKVGKDVEADARRLGRITTAARGEVTIRVDANRAYSLAQALQFVDLVDWSAVALFEQPCHAEDWDANAAVARACPVPVMLDEPICSLADVERAAGLDGVGYCKVKLKRFGGISRLVDAIDRAQGLGLRVVLGDGLSGDIGCWMEACVAAARIETAGEFNGFLKPIHRQLANPYRVEQAQLVLPQNYWPQPDLERIEAACLERLDV